MAFFAGFFIGWRFFSKYGDFVCSHAKCLYICNTYQFRLLLVQ